MNKGWERQRRWTVSKEASQQWEKQKYTKVGPRVVKSIHLLNGALMGRSARVYCQGLWVTMASLLVFLFQIPATWLAIKFLSIIWSDSFLWANSKCKVSTDVTVQLHIYCSFACSCGFFSLFFVHFLFIAYIFQKDALCSCFVQVMTVTV